MSNLNMSPGELLAATVPADDVVKITSGEAFAVCRALWVGTSGSATIVTAAGSTRSSVPLFQGINPIRCTTVTLGTAADVWAMY